MWKSIWNEMKSDWVWFRKRFFLLRLLILLSVLFFCLLEIAVAQMLFGHSSLIQGLVSSACISIRNAADSKLIPQEIRYRRALNNQRLARQLAAKPDGLTADERAELLRPAVQRNERKLHAAAIRLGATPPQDIRQLLRDRHVAAIAAVEREFGPLWRDVNNDIRNSRSWVAPNAWWGINYLIFIIEQPLALLYPGHGAWNGLLLALLMITGYELAYRRRLWCGIAALLVLMAIPIVASVSFPLVPIAGAVIWIAAVIAGVKCYRMGTSRQKLWSYTALLLWIGIYLNWQTMNKWYYYKPDHRMLILELAAATLLTAWLLFRQYRACAKTSPELPPVRENG